MKNAIPFAEPTKKVRRIDWSNPEDVRAVVIAKLGFSNNCVREYNCNLSDGQIGYRLKLAGSAKARKEFRDGKSQLAKRIMKQNEDYVVGQVVRQVHRPHQTETRTQKAA